MKLAYMAHPLGPEGEQRTLNLVNASKWFAWLHDTFQNIVFSANWIVLASQWDEATGRSRGLEIDEIHVDCSDLFFMVGGKVSEGMAREQVRAVSRRVQVIDLTFLGWAAPGTNDVELTATELGLLKVIQQLACSLRASEEPETPETPEHLTTITVADGGTLYFGNAPHEPGKAGSSGIGLDYLRSTSAKRAEAGF